MPVASNRRFRLRHAAWWTFAVGMAATGLLGWSLHREAVRMDRQRLAVRVAEVTSQLDARLEKSEMLLHNLRDYLMFSGENRDQVFARWCYENGLSINCPWLHAIAVATNANQAQWRDKMPKLLEAWTATDWEEFTKLARGQLVDCRIAMRSEVRDGKQFAARYGFQQEYAGSEPLARAIHGSRVGMSERKSVMMDANSNYLVGTYYYVPVYKPEAVDLLAITSLDRNQSTYIRWTHLTSLIVAPMDFKELARSVWDGMAADLGMELFAAMNQTAGTWLDGSTGTPRAADPHFTAYLTHRQPWRMYGQDFSIFFYTTPLFEAQSPGRLIKIVVVTGGILTLLATAWIATVMRGRERQELLTEQIREARDALSAAQTERDKISRDLHDGTVQSLYSIQLRLDHTVETLEGEPAKARQELPELRRELDRVIGEIRQFIIAEKRVKKRTDFSSVLHAVVQRARAGTPAGITLQCDSDTADRLSQDQAVQLASIAREGLSNSLRHAKPRKVEIALRWDAEAVVLEISDDGDGFDPKLPRRAGLGLASMESRARELGGRLEVQSAPGQGTRLTVRVPTISEEHPETEVSASRERES